MHEFGVGEERARGGQDDEGEEAVVDVAVRAQVLARVGALDLEAFVRALMTAAGVQLVCCPLTMWEPQGCQMAKFDPFLSLDCARVEGVGAQSKERKGSNFAA